MTDTTPDLPPEEPFPGEEPPVEDSDHHESPIDRMRHSGVGVEDPHIVGDVGPTDVPPGTDPDSVT